MHSLFVLGRNVHIIYIYRIMILQKYADLLVNYCVEVRKGEKVLIASTTLAEPLVREVYRSVLEAGGHPFMELDIRNQDYLLYKYGEKDQLKQFSPTYKEAMENFDCYIAIRAPYNIFSNKNSDPMKAALRQKAGKQWRDLYFERTATRELKRTLCQFPTTASAQLAQMPLTEYEEFVFGACKLYADDPLSEWLKVRDFQQEIADKLNKAEIVRYVNDKSETDISFSCQGRTWINSHGTTNMPSGEVYTSPVEDSVNGTIYFSYPSFYRGKEVQGVRLNVKDGYIESWEAKKGKKFLDHIFKLEGTRRFGEAAIGTNKDITQVTRNILFDEKMGGSVHMAIGQSYLQAGGKNNSTVHWDMITDMKKGGKIYTDKVLFYENGKFLSTDE